MKKGKDQELTQSSTTPDPGYQWESGNFTFRHQRHQESRRKITTKQRTLHRKSKVFQKSVVAVVTLEVQL